ncbi:Lacal_2735 family protein [Winogradskyella psychrotolerans]|nr:Lacal_2735 family protein [Winogradskyella psychrotolerans]
MAEYHKLSTSNRAKSDKKYAEAQLIADKIDTLK